MDLTQPQTKGAHTMDTIRWVAKAVTAGLTGFLTAIAAYNLDVPAGVLVGVATVLGAVAVFLVPNGDHPGN